MNGMMMTGARLDGMKGWDHNYDNSASSLSLGGLDLGDMNESGAV